ncbi:CHAD domain-containing protein [uncultured Jatrophihabitans sp.]|uniref:CYTH and CHAD domain-containing protein n=1 Tax=uncultured Jatrophihabitans sp. TaxID=1610747 RepID=UPI0035CADBB1
MAEKSSTAQRERELKFDVPDGWTVPDLRKLIGVDGSVRVEERTLESTYFDTDARELLDAGLTLRRRTGDDDSGWHLKVPAGDARTEIRLPLGGRGVPLELRELTTGIRGRAALKPLATLRTTRIAHQLLDGDGTPLLEVVDDTVRSSTQREFAVLRHWREVEVELLEGGAEKLLRRAAALLRKNGAWPAESASKLARALDVATRRPRESGTLSGAVGRYLDEQYEVLLRGDIALRRGGSGDPEHGELIHKTRVATRRYRSVLRVFAGALDEARATGLDGELAWFAAALGEIRDRQVLRAHLDAALDELPAELVLGPVRTRIHQTLAAEQQRAEAELAQHVRSRRYVNLQAELRAWRASLPLLEDASDAELERYLDDAERKIAKRVRAAESTDDSDEAYHRVRKAAKRARYVAELAGPVLGKRAGRLERRAKEVQTRLGDRQDDVVAASFLRRLGAAAGVAPGENGFTFGLLYQRERTRGGRIHPRG